MKPFDIEKALDGEPVVTRSGQPVTELTLFYATKEEYCLRGVLEHEIMG